jgi:hypothetical protein
MKTDLLVAVLVSLSPAANAGVATAGAGGFLTAPPRPCRPLPDKLDFLGRQEAHRRTAGAHSPVSQDAAPSGTLHESVLNLWFLEIQGR